MDVVLLVYDLSQGLARQLSAGLLGFQLDAVYHTSIKINGREYVYDGGIVDIAPESSHLGRAVERITLGRTELPMDTIREYVDSVRTVFTFEAYDLFTHNCNNFTDSFAKFLLGTGIPSHIIDMPRRVLASPMGQALYLQLTQSVRAHRDQGGSNGSVLGIGQTASPPPAPSAPSAAKTVAAAHEATSLAELQGLLRDAASSCAVVYFTSLTCAPCRALTAPFASLAAEMGSRGKCIKVDISRAQDAAAHFDVRATPTFITFLRGEQERRWSGADAAALRGNALLLVQMAWPPHPHRALAGGTFRKDQASVVLFARTPPLAKLLAKLGTAAEENPVRAVASFIEIRDKSGAAEARLPDLEAFGAFVRRAMTTLPPEVLFAAVDLLRCAVLDPRASTHFAAEKAVNKNNNKNNNNKPETGVTTNAATDAVTLLSVIRHVNLAGDQTPYALRLVTLHLACNMFGSALFAGRALSQARLRESLISLVTSSLLDAAHPASRAAAASLVFNMALADRRARGVDDDDDNNNNNNNNNNDTPNPLGDGGATMEGGAQQDALQEDEQAELAAALVEAIRNEGEETRADDNGGGGGNGSKSGGGGTSADVLRAMLLALGQLAWYREQTGETAALLRAVGAEEAVLAKKDIGAFKAETALIDEVGRDVLGKWLAGKGR